jgi:protein-disulfide isomerase
MNINSVAIALFLPSLFAGLACAQCPPVKDADQAKLIEYVQKKYKTPAKLQLEITKHRDRGVDLLPQTRIRRQESGASFHLELYASPGLRFLARELLDSTVDPAIEERMKADPLATGLDRPGLPAIGKKDAPVTIAVFSDFQCPYCSGFANTAKAVLPEEVGNVRLIFHAFPLPMHPWARPAAEAALCAQQQGDTFFWALHDFMFEHQKEITPDTLQPKLAAVTKGFDHFDQGQFATCLVDRKTAATVDEEIAFAQKNGINATPTVFINGRQTKVVAPEQLRTLIQQLSGAQKPASADCSSGRCIPPAHR